MSIKTKKKTVMACIAVLVILTLAITLSYMLRSPLTAQAAETSLHATYGGSHGQLTDVAGGHRSETEEVDYLINTYNVHANNIYKIDTSEKLYNFLNNKVESSYTHGYLTKDMSIAYGNGQDASGLYEYKTSDYTSGAVFNKFLDGNGYNVSIWSQTGEANYVDQTDSYYSYGSITYRVAGLLCAVNQGTISNLTIDFSSNHGTVNAVTGWTYPNVFTGWQNSGLDNDATFCIWFPKSTNCSIFGIVCGENGANGFVDNVRVNIKNNLTVIDRRSTSGGKMVQNMIYVGGLAGRALRDSEINDCQVDIADNVVLCGTAEGDNESSGTAKGSLAVVGGILGKIDQTTSDGTGVHAAVLQYCALTGSGMVKALANKAQGNNDYYRAYSGGIVGACLNVSSENGGISDGGKDSGTPHTAEPGQIKSIISDWTGECQNNYSNVNTTIMGQLFGSIGSSVQNCVVLYDLLANRADRGQTTETIDSFRSAVLTAWVGVYPTSELGEVVVRFNSDETSIYDIRIHAFADDCDKNDAELLKVSMGTSRNTQYTLANGLAGNIIWESAYGTSERINLRIANPVYAEVLAVSANVKDAINYTWSFGRMTTLAFSNTNGTTYTRAYGGMAATLNKPTVSAALSGVSLNYTNDNWEILRNGAVTSSDMSGTALPGTYTMNVKASINTYVDLGYYDQNQRIAAWQPEAYKYVITEGVLSYGSGTSVLSDWNYTAKFELTMPSEDPNVRNFDMIRFVRNGTVVVGSEDKFDYDGNNASITVDETTGPNGMKYSFIAYAWDGDSAIVVARTDSSQDYLVKIDREAPEVSDIAYYTIDGEGNVIQKINERDLATWRTERVLVKYVVSDNKSGIKFAESTNGIVNTPLSNDGSSYEVAVTLSNSNVRTVSYTDNMNNKYELTLQANVDYMTSEPRLALYNYTYASSENGYSTSGVIVRFKPTIGSSAWYLQYSCEKDADGNDIWVNAPAQDAYGADIDGQDYLIEGNRTQSFTINWNMGTSVPRVEADFKLRMVNELYGEVPLSKYDSDLGEYFVEDNGLVAGFIINFKVARLYVDTSLESILVYGGNGEYNYDGESLADIIARANADEIQAIFGKTYDGTTDYVNADYRFEIKVKYEYDDANRESFAQSTGVGVLYSPAYIKRPQDIDTTLAISLAYASASAGTTSIIATFNLTSDITDKYDVYFVNHDSLAEGTFADDYSVIQGFDSCEVISVDIEPLVKPVSLEKYLQSSYYYGETIPEVIYGASVEGLEGTFDIVITSDLTSICDANQDYWVYGEVYDELSNIFIDVEPVQVRVLPLPVYLDVEMDNGATTDIPTSVNAGTKHTIEAYYYDLNNNRIQATTSYYLLADNGDPTEKYDDGIAARGRYKIVISIKDANYVTADQGPDDGHYTEGTYQFFFNITQGVLGLAMTTNVVEFRGAGVGIAYDPGIPEVDSKIFNERQLSYKYYKYTDATKYSIVNGEVVITNEYDKNDYLGEKVLPSERGIYRVEISMTGNDSFQSYEYEGFMIITQAATEFDVISSRRVERSYTGEYYTLTLSDIQAKVLASSTQTQLWDLQTGDMSKVSIYYYDLNSGSGNGWKLVSSEKGGDGWFNTMGQYYFLVAYAGDDDFAACNVEITFIITEAEFQNVWFTDVTGVYNGKNYATEIRENVPSGVTKRYIYNFRTYDSLSDIPALVNVGVYTITVRLSMTNFKTTDYTVTVTITEAQFAGVSATPYLGTYDEQEHTVIINGLTQKSDGYYYTVKDSNGVAVKDSNGNNIEVKVTVTGKSEAGLTDGLYAIDAGTYSVTITLSAANYADLTLDTVSITIEPVRWPVDSTWTNMPSKIPSGVSVSGYYGSYTNSSTTTECTLIYTNADGEVVEPDSNGILPDGKYTVTLHVDDRGNYYVDHAWTLTVGRINSAELSPVSIAVLCVAIAVIVAAIVTAVVVVNKRKKADGIAK